MAERVNTVIVYRGDDQELRFVMTTNGSVAGWTTLFTVRTTAQSPNPPALQAAGTILDSGSTTTPGVFGVTLSQASLLALILTTDRRDYTFAFRRTNTGANATLTKGRMAIEADIEHALM